MISAEEARVFAVGGITLAAVLGGGLTVSVVFAATMPIHAPVRETLTRVCTWVGEALSVVLRGLYVVLGLRLAYGLAVTYFHLGWREQRHIYMVSGYRRRKPAGGRHRPEVVAANPWRPVLRWMPDGYTPYVEWTYPA